MEQNLEYITMENMVNKLGAQKACDQYLYFVDKYDKKHNERPISCREHDLLRVKTWNRYCKMYYNI